MALDFASIICRRTSRLRERRSVSIFQRYPYTSKSLSGVRFSVVKKYSFCRLPLASVILHTTKRPSTLTWLGSSGLPLRSWRVGSQRTALSVPADGLHPPVHFRGSRLRETKQTGMLVSLGIVSHRKDPEVPVPHRSRTCRQSTQYVFRQRL